MMRRLLLLASAVSLPAMCQSSGAATDAPLTVAIDTGQIDLAQGGGLGAYLEVRNASLKNIRGYVLRILVIDPSSGAVLARQSSGTSTSKVDGIRPVIAPGQVTRFPRPIPLPATASGKMAECRVSVDIVVFEDGTTWGPAGLRASASLVKRIAAKDRQ